MADTFSRGGTTVRRYATHAPRIGIEDRFAVETSHSRKLDLSRSAAISTCLALADALGLVLTDEGELKQLAKYKAAWQAMSKGFHAAADSLVGA